MRSFGIVLMALIGLALPASAFAHEGHDHPPEHVDTIREVQMDFAAAVESGSATSVPGAIGSIDLPRTHCGPAAPLQDDKVSAVHAPNLAQFKVVYAYASDTGNRYEQWRNAIQANVSLIGRYLSNESGGRRAPRFDMGTAGEGCGVDYVDIQVVALPGTQATYNRNFDLVDEHVRARVDPAPGGPRNLLIVADRMSDRTLLYGQGELWMGGSGDREDSANLHNLGDRDSIIWIPNTVSPPADQREGYWPEGFLHEMTHNMGAVQWSAPHTSRSTTSPDDGTYAHCWDGLDLMCYDDGPQKGHAYEATHCPSIGGAMPQTYDCGRDDYFDPRPAASAHFDDHWNTFDSVFLGDCAAVGKACGWDGTSPTATTLPAVTGTVRALASATADAGAWTGSPSFSYQWQREVAGDWTDVAGATATTLAIEEAWSGTFVRLVVTATNAAGVSTARSLPVRVASPEAPANLTQPTFSELLEHGSALTAATGDWQRVTSFGYQWYRWTGAWVPIPGATQRTYRLSASDVGAHIYVAVRGSNSAGWREVPSAVRGPVAAARAPQTVTPPTVTGTAKQGSDLTASDNGTWDRDVLSHAYQWQRNAGGTWTDIASATSSTYRLVAADVGLAVRVLVTATGYATMPSAPAASNASAAVERLRIPVATTDPSVTGRARSGQTLTGSMGAWTDATSIAHRWERRTDGTWQTVAGATGLTYALTDADLGATIRLVVTATGVDGTTARETAATETVVAPQPPAASGAPVVSGTPKRTRPLSVTDVTWAGAESSDRRWQRSTDTGWAAIDGATAGTYTPTQADVGRRIRVEISATNADGTTTRTSNETAAVADLTPPTASTDPVLTGTAKRTRTLSVSEVGWTGATTTGRRWERSTATGWTEIAGATGASYTLVADDVGRRVRAVVSATNDDGTTERTSGETAVVTELAPPVPSGDPVVSGTAKRTRTLSVSTVTWTGATSSTLRWQRSTDTGWQDIDAATGSSYAPVALDVGRRLRVQVSASNEDGTTTRASEATAIVAELTPPAGVSAPSVSGTTRRTHVLTSTEGVWSGATSRTTQWQRSTETGWATIDGATVATYTLGTQDVGRRIRSVVTASNGDGTSSQISAATDVIAPQAPVPSAEPVVTGTAKRTRPLAVTDVSWAAATTSARQWQRSVGAGWEDIAGANGLTYTPTAGDVGRRLRVQAGATNEDGTTTRTSNETAEVVDLQPPVSIAAPTVTGTATRTGVLTTTSGSWTGAASSSIRWQRSTDAGWADIAGATSESYVLGSADVGRRLRSVLTATNGDGSAASESAATDVVADLVETVVVVKPPAPGPGPAPAPPVTVLPPPPAATPPAGSTAPQTAAPSAPQAFKLRSGSRILLDLGVARDAGGKVRVVLRKPGKLRRGRHQLQVCAGGRCVKRKFTVAGARPRVPAVAVAADPGDTVKITLTGASGRASGSLRLS